MDNAEQMERNATEGPFVSEECAEGECDFCFDEDCEHICHRLEVPEETEER